MKLQVELDQINKQLNIFKFHKDLPKFFVLKLTILERQCDRLECMNDWSWWKSTYLWGRFSLSFAEESTLMNDLESIIPMIGFEKVDLSSSWDFWFLRCFICQRLFHSCHKIGILGLKIIYLKVDCLSHWGLRENCRTSSIESWISIAMSRRSSRRIRNLHLMSSKP